MNKPKLCNPEYCTGCGVCKSICPEKCITMVYDSAGFLRPLIDETKCVSCLLCEKYCVLLTDSASNNNVYPRVLACWHKDVNVLFLSSSGGVFSSLAEHFLNNSGVVFGAAYDCNLIVKHKAIFKIDEIDMLRRSKYVQSDIGETYCQAKHYLQEGRPVLFVGTPCQIKGLNVFLNKIYDNLLTLDFVCHGVPSPLFFLKYIDWLGNIYGGNVDSINFRNKSRGWENVTVSATINNKKFILKGKLNSFYNFFIQGLSLRESCFHCPYMKFPRVADITIGDFWGIGEKYPFGHCVDEGVSLLMINNNKLNSFSYSFSNLFYEERNFDEAIMNNIHFSKPVDKPRSYDDFLAAISGYPYDYIVTHFLNLSIKRRILNFIKENIDVKILSKLRSMSRKHYDL